MKGAQVPRPRRRLEAGEVHRVLAWDDPTIYRWSLQLPLPRGRDRRCVELAVWWLMAMTGLLLAGYLPLWLLGKLWLGGAFWGGAASLAMLGVLYLGSWVVELLPRTSVEWRDTVHNRPIYPAVAAGVLVYLITAAGSEVGAGFGEGAASYTTAQWALYFWEHVRSVLFLDLPRAFGGRLTAISPATGLALAAVLAFRVTFSIGLAECAGLTWRRFRHQQVFHATVRGAWVASRDPLVAELVLRCEGRLEELPQPQKMLAAELAESLKDLARR